MLASPLLDFPHMRRNSAKVREMQSALVTGAGSGIGRAIARALLAEGMHVRLVGRDPRKLVRVAADAPMRAVVLPADLATDDGLATVAASIDSRLDVLVHCAGLYAHAPTLSITAERWAALDAVNLRAPLVLTKACLAALRAATGQVVFMNSSAGLRAAPGLAAYAAGKHALKAAVQTLRQEVNGDGIRVLSVFPGRTDTPMQQEILKAEGRAAKPGTLMRAEDVASMVLAALKLPRTAEVTDIVMRPMRPMG